MVRVEKQARSRDFDWKYNHTRLCLAVHSRTRRAQFSFKISGDIFPVT
jgi:hypothetical protein